MPISSWSPVPQSPITGKRTRVLAGWATSAGVPLMTVAAARVANDSKACRRVILSFIFLNPLRTKIGSATRRQIGRGHEEYSGERRLENHTFLVKICVNDVIRN